MPLCSHSVGTYQGKELTRFFSRNTRRQSSHLAEPLGTDPGIKNGISVHGLISTSKTNKQKKRWRGMNGRTFCPKSLQARKSHHRHSLQTQDTVRR